jgi:7-cyano-7-deazaguanine synthase in queuosine biosynthesis
MKTTVFAWSGGLDCVLAALTLVPNRDDARWLFVTVDMDGMTAEENALVADLAGHFGGTHRVVALREPPSAWERATDVFSFQRNLLILALCAREAMRCHPDTRELVLVVGQAADDLVSDNNADFREAAAAALTFGLPDAVSVRVVAPNAHELKHEAMARVWSQRGTDRALLRTVSCYRGQVDEGSGIYGCGQCPSCFRAALAFLAFEDEHSLDLRVVSRYANPVLESEVAKAYLARALLCEEAADSPRGRRDRLVRKYVGSD